MNDLRVLVVADAPLVRAGLAALLSDQPGCVVVGRVASDTDAAGVLGVYRPDVAVWDLGQDQAASLDPLSDVTDTGLPVVALLPDQTYVASTRATGARGLLLRDVDGPSLAAALAAVARGLAVLSGELSSPGPAPGEHPRDPIAVDLTPREREVLTLLAEGMPNKSIADSLSISEHTVKFHVNAILGKLGAQSRTEAATRATRMGMIPL